MSTPTRRAVLTLSAAAVLTAAPAIAATPPRPFDAPAAHADAAWRTARHAALSLPAGTGDGMVNAAWDVESAAGCRLAELTAATPEAAATQLRWLLAQLQAGILPDQAESLLARLADALDGMAGVVG